MKNFKEVYVHDKVIVALNPDKEKYLNYERSTNRDLIENIGVRCHDCEEFNSFGVPKKFYITNGEYTRLIFPEVMVLKENANVKLLVDDEGELLA